MSLFDAARSLLDGVDYSSDRTLAESKQLRRPRSQAHDGNVWWDLLRRGQDGDPSLFVQHLAGPDAWAHIPWLTQKFMAQAERQFATTPNCYRRLHLNEWPASDESSFLTAEEIASAVDPALVEPARGLPGVAYVMGIDLAVSNDWCAVLVGHVGSDFKLTVDCLRYWRGSPAAPVSLRAVENEVLNLASRFRSKVLLDQWQGRLLGERLQRRGRLPVKLLTTGATWLDKSITN